MSLIYHYSPIAMHFGALDTRLLQLKGGPGGWAVEAYAVYAASGDGRHAQAMEMAKQELGRLRLHGKDSLIALSGESTAINLVPVETESHSRLEQLLQDTASRAVQDPEGICYRYLTMSGDESAVSRDEYMLLSIGSSELRRCQNAAEILGLRPCGIEMNAFPIARALSAVNAEQQDPWGFLHIGFNNSLFGIVHEDEIRFLKPMQLTGEALLTRLQETIAGFSDQSEEINAEDIFAPHEDNSTTFAPDSAGIATMHRNAVGHAVELLHSLRTESEGLAQELRACLRHFATRNRGAHMDRIHISGFGAALPEVESALANAIALPISLAKPFTALGISAPNEVLAEEHLWCTALGLAMRGYE